MAGTSSNIPNEVLSHEEMLSIEAALDSASAPSASAPSASVTPPSIHSHTSVEAKRTLLYSAEPDIEDYGKAVTSKKKRRVAETLLHRFRSKRGLFVTDVTKTEWCEKQMEFSLFFQEWKNNNEPQSHDYFEERCIKKQTDLAPHYGRRWNNNDARKAGVARHNQLEKEVLEHVAMKVNSEEDYMALKLVNFIIGVNQLLNEGLTRELPIVAFAFEEGIWMVGKIDEIRMPILENVHNHNPILIDTKTRARDTIPAEAQKRNGRIQLMCYKYLWDTLISHHNDFPSKHFFDYFGLNSKFTLSDDVQVACADSGLIARTLDDVVTCYKITCKKLPLAHDQLVLRYEYQKDMSLIDEDKFSYDDVWLKNKIKNCLEFWIGGRDANYVADEEEWKCGFCDFLNDCPAYSDMSDSTEPLTSDESYPRYHC